jgi:small-conductance mechanosensitive channel
MDEVLEYEVLNNPLGTWGTSLAIFLATWVLFVFAHRFIAARLKAFAGRKNVTALYVVERVVRRTQVWFPPLFALFLSARLIVSTPALTTLFERIVVLGLLIQIGLWATGALTAYLSQRRRRQLVDSPGDVATTDLLWLVLRMCVWVLIVLLALDNLGMNVTTLIAGLGIGGVAVALAAQNILGDLFASFSIVMDRPFVVGDSLGIDTFTGTVERVGMKTTRLRSVSGEQLIFSNTDLLSSRIRNFGRMVERRVSFTIGVTYRTPVEDLRRIPQILQSVVAHEKEARFERAHFTQYGEFALIFEVVYHVLSPSFDVHSEIRQRVNLALFERFAEEGIEFGFPTQKLYLSGADADGLPGVGERVVRKAPGPH